MKLTLKKLLPMILAIAIILSVAGCGQKNKDDSSSTDGASSSKTPSSTAVGENGSRTDKKVGFQLQSPEENEEIAVFETTLGTICFRLFPDEAPLAVENFVSLINEGYYNNITFHRVVNSDTFGIVQGGDPTATGSGGASIWGENFEDEFNANLVNLRGSLAMANSGANTNGSQFFINTTTNAVSKADAETNEANFKASYDQAKTYYKTEYDQYVQYYGNEFTKIYPSFDDYFNKIYYCAPIVEKVSDEVWELYDKYGGNISLDGAFRDFGGHTVFGQVFKGMDVVDKIAAVEVDQNSKPVEKVIITKAYITKYTSETESSETESVSDEK